MKNNSGFLFGLMALISVVLMIAKLAYSGFPAIIVFIACAITLVLSCIAHANDKNHSSWLTIIWAFNTLMWLLGFILK
jgi:uncharacterized membrane protein